MTNNQKAEALRKFSVYPFSSDEVFQQGLIRILEHDDSAQVISEQGRSELELRTQLFYFNRQTGCDLSLEDVRSLTSRLSLLPSSMLESPPFTSPTHGYGHLPPPVELQAESSEAPPRVLTFVELKDLIESGNAENIPYNKHIPDQINVCDLLLSGLECILIGGIG
ncbi:hypothetical protein J3A83DRAFT_2913481 [Scleroderma citrinum]